MRHLSLTLSTIVCLVLVASPAAADKAGPGGKPAGNPNVGHKKSANHAAEHQQKQQPDGENKAANRKKAEEAHDRLMKKFDANGDGKLDAQERAAAREAWERHQKQAGDGAPNPRMQELLKRFDA